MSDLISRQAAIDALHMHLMYRMGTDSNKKRLDDWINGVPSVQPEIIRCTECKHYREYDSEYVECPFCHSATNCDGNKDELHYCFSCGAELRGEQE